MVSPKKSPTCILRRVWAMMLWRSLGVVSSSSSRLSRSFFVSYLTTVCFVLNNPHRCRFFSVWRLSTMSFMCFAPRIKVAAISPNSWQSLATDNVSSITLSSSRWRWGKRETPPETRIKVATLGGAIVYVLPPIVISSGCWRMVWATFSSIVFSIAVRY